ncbi:hypothetical protein EBU99_04910 [bacterium]|nr:hypothetical protein [bacterium]
MTNSIFKKHARSTALCLGMLLCSSAFAFYGLDINDLPRDGDVTIPGDYPIMVRKKGTVQLSGLNDSLTLNLVNPNPQAAIVQIAASSEKKTRTLRVMAGVPTLYNAKTSKEVTLRVTDGDVTITSIHPLKVQHPGRMQAPGQLPAIQK